MLSEKLFGAYVSRDMSYRCEIRGAWSLHPWRFQHYALVGKLVREAEETAGYRFRVIATYGADTGIELDISKAAVLAALNDAQPRVRINRWIVEQAQIAWSGYMRSALILHLEGGV